MPTFAKIIFAKISTALQKRAQRGLSYGVMVAQQVLVLFVLVRIQVGQQQKSQLYMKLTFLLYKCISLLGCQQLLQSRLLLGSQVLQ